MQLFQAQQQDPAMLEQLSKNITRQGLTNSTLNYLRVSHGKKLLLCILVKNKTTLKGVLCITY